VGDVLLRFNLKMFCSRFFILGETFSSLEYCLIVEGSVNSPILVVVLAPNAMFASVRLLI
jgi:hypothetical protein